MDCGEMDAVKSEKQEAMDPVKTEEMMPMDPFKPEAMKKIKRNRKAKKLLRYALVAVSAVLLSWSSVWIPVVVQTMTLYFRFACTVIASQKFVFFMCNAIIITLAAKSGQLSPSNSGPDIYEEFVSRKHAGSSESVLPESVSPEPEPEEEKRCVFEESAALPEEEEPKAEEFAETKEIEAAETKEVVQVEVKSSKRGKVGRSRSGNLDQKIKPKLRRSETGIENVDNQPEDGENSNSIVPAAPDSGESNDDFNKRIEDFIHKQRLLRRQESLAIVPPSDGN